MSAYIDITFYVIGLVTMLIIFALISPMAIDLVNFSGIHREQFIVTVIHYGQLLSSHWDWC
jgi:hypothetical protein